jgi:hypothetical protein
MVHNEAFTETAQKRGSVVSSAKEKGYTPRSYRGSEATLNVTVNNVGDTLFLKRGSVFTASNDNRTYDFLVVSDTASQTSGLNQIFTNLAVKNGVQVSNLFAVDTTANIRSIYTIPNSQVDTSTLRVYVRDTTASTSRIEYTLAENAYGLTGESRVFFLQEGYDGKYQIYFGSDVIGKQPVNGNLVEIDYFVSPENKNADGCKTFFYGGTIGNISGTSITTVQSSIGGAVKESIESIKVNASKSNSAKERSVSVSDYELAISEKFPYIKSSAIWGGEENNPPVYGKVFVSLQPVVGVTITEATKQNVIAPIIRKNSVLTVIPEFLDPEYLNLSFTTKIKFNSSKSVASKAVTEGLVKTQVANYIEKISTFNTDYLQSELEGLIKSLDPGISSVSISKQVGFKITPLIDVNTNYSRNIANAIIPQTIGSTKFTVVTGTETAVVSIKEIADKTISITTNTGIIQQVATLGLYTDSGELVQEIGTVNLSTGKFDFTINVLDYLTVNRFIHISFTLVDDDVSTVRNQIIVMNSVAEDSAIGLINNNRVITELYDKNT